MGRMGEQRQYDDPERTTGDWRTARASDDGPAGGGGGGGGDDDRFRSRGPPGGGGFDRREGGGGGFERRERDDRDSGFEDNKPGNWRDAPRESMDSRPRPSFRDSRPGAGEERGETRDWNR